MRKIFLFIFLYIISIAHSSAIVLINFNGNIGYKLERTDTVIGCIDNRLVVKEENGDVWVLYDYVEGKGKERGVFIFKDKLN